MQVQIARIGKPHGIRGEVTVQVMTDDPESRFVPGASFVVDPDKLGPLTVSSARWNKDILLLGFSEVADRNGAELLRGARLLVETDDVDDDDDDAWYEHELVGLKVRIAGAGDAAGDTEPGQDVGTISALQTMPAQDLLVVETHDGAEVLVPFVAEIVPEVNIEAGYVLLDPPEGLFDLNREDGASGGGS